MSRNVPSTKKGENRRNFHIEHGTTDTVQLTNSVVNTWEKTIVKSLLLAIGFVSVAGLAFGATPPASHPGYTELKAAVRAPVGAVADPSRVRARRAPRSLRPSAVNQRVSSS